MKNKDTWLRWLSAMLAMVLLVCAVMPMEAQAAVNGAGAGVSGAAGAGHLSGGNNLAVTNSKMGKKVERNGDVPAVYIFEERKLIRHAEDTVHSLNSAAAVKGEVDADMVCVALNYNIKRI